MGAGSGRLSRTAAGLLLTGLVVASGTGSAVAAQHRLDTTHAAAKHDAQVALSQAMSIRIERLTDRARQYATTVRRLSVEEPRELLAAAPHTDFTSLVVAAPTLPLRVTSGPQLPADLASGAASELADAAASARDNAEPLAVVTGSTASPYVVVVWPLYRGMQVRGSVPADTQARRNASAGWVVGSVPVTRIAAPVIAGVRALGDAASLTDVPAGPAPVGQTLRGALGARVTAVPAPSWLGVLLLVVLTVLAGSGILAFTLVLRRADRRSAGAQLAIDELVRLVSDISITIQESLDIGVVLPAVLAQIAQRLELTWIRVATGPADGLELLALGRRPARLPVQRSSPDTTTVNAGQPIRLPLRRATRTLGHLEVIPAAPLDAPRMAALRQCADLLAGALHNAELYEREQETVRQLRELDVLKDDFLGTVSHELRTPLSVLGGSVSLLTKSWDRLPDESRQAAVARLQPHVASLTNLVNDLLDFVNDRRTSTDAAPTVVALDQEVAALAEQLRPLVQQHELVVEASGPVTAWTDTRSLERIIGNLVGNAGKYSPAGTTIRIDVGQLPDEAFVAVSDQGPGIRPEDRERIFERFYRGHSQAARSSRGTGIGLAVVLAWVKAVGAHLDVQTGVGHGTTMTVRFPTGPDVPVDGAGAVTWKSVDVVREEIAT